MSPHPVSSDGQRLAGEAAGGFLGGRRRVDGAAHDRVGRELTRRREGLADVATEGADTGQEETPAPAHGQLTGLALDGRQVGGGDDEVAGGPRGGAGGGWGG